MSPLVGCPGPGGFLSGGAFVWGPFARSPKFNAYTGLYAPSRLSVHRSVTDKQKDKLGPVAPRGVDPRSPNFQGM